MLIPSLLAAALLTAGHANLAIDPTPEPLPSTVIEGDTYIRLPSRAPRIRTGRPFVLPAMYASFVALQMGDAALTEYGMNHGYREGNPILGGGLGTGLGTTVPLKIGTSVLAIWAVDHMWKRGHHAAAVVTIIGANVIGAAVVSRNISVLNGR